MWNKSELLKKLEEQISVERFNHIQGVIETAIKLAIENGINPDEAEMAAILHDYCKAWPVEKMKELLIRHSDLAWLDYSPVLWHAPAAYYYAQEELHMTNETILNAVYYHTTGRPEMSPLEKVLWVADYIEPNRSFPGVEEARRLASIDLDAALSYGLRQTIVYLLEKNQPVYPLTFEAYNYYVKQIGGKII